MCERSWITPFLKQCFATSGAFLNMLTNGLTVGFSTVIITQLKETEFIHIDDDTGSWIASIMGISLIVGILMVPTVMNLIGRKLANLTSAIIMTLGWFCIMAATTVPVILVARFLQGVSMGFTSIVGPVLIGEYSSPKHRGLFLGTISFNLFTGVLVSHSLGSVLSWQKTATVCAFISIVNIVIILFSPESPSILAAKGKYDECRKAFHWLRGLQEEDELEKMIKADLMNKADQPFDEVQSVTIRIKRRLRYVVITIKKKEFYKPIFLMLHLHAINEWSGSTLHDSYAKLIDQTVIGMDVNLSYMIASINIQRIVSSALAIMIINRIKRRTMLLITVSLNITAYLLIAGYTYMKVHNMLPYDHPAIGITFIHLQMFSIASGSLSLPNIISGEIFPLEYRSVSSMIAVLFFSLNFFINIKTAPFLFSTIGLYGQYCLSAGIISYCLIVLMIMLPETKDRTLQDIEGEFRGETISANIKLNSSIPLQDL